MDNDKRIQVRALVVITTDKSAVRAAELFKEKGFPVQYAMLAEGTASSEMLDMLGLGSTEKRMLMTTLPRPVAEQMLKTIHDDLALSRADGGIAFTLPITGLSNLIMRMMNGMAEGESKRKEGNTMTDNKFSLVTAVVNRGFSNDVMVAAREAGARGGTVIHSRQLLNEDSTNFWGVSMQEEKDILLIITDIENKITIMKAIGESFGINSEAKGIVLSMPIDSVTGF